ncbi:MAG: 16S rRNA (uracil(1498)-N(3))-methyltransferase [Desulfovibrio sp.]
MSRLNSFHLPPDRWPGPEGEVLLEGTEAKHMLQVLRTPTGSVVRLFDGLGRDGLFELLPGGKKTARLRVQHIAEHPRSQAGLTLALGWNKSSRRGWLLEKSVELCADGIAFWRAARSQGEPPLVKDSWQEKLIQSAKQCGNPWLPELACLSGGLDGLLAFGQGFTRRFLLWESSAASVLLRPSMISPGLCQGRCLAVLGPEGGLEPEEVDRLTRGGFEPVTLGKSVLRWETAALHCLSLAFYGAQRAEN